MGYHKKNGYVPLYEVCSFESGVFTHPVRIKILKILSETSCTHEEIYRQVALEKSTVSHHLEVLLRRDLIEYSEKHPWVFYRLKHESLRQLMRRFQSLMEEILGGDDSLEV